MSVDGSKFINDKQAAEFLTGYFGVQVKDLEIVGEGAWSRCFGFRHGEDDLVIRFGRHLDDFAKDKRASAFAAPGLPIPQVLDIGEAFGGYYAISQRVYGEPLELVDAVGWRALVPALVDALEVMRTVDLSDTSGFGGWNEEGMAPYARWSDRLLAIGQETNDDRTVGRMAQLAQHPEGQATFRWGYDLLQEIVDDSVPRSLIHGDLINRNVLVEDGRLNGVFDWGCSVYGDHLYDLAWFEFWSPWYPDLDIELLRSALTARWREVGYFAHNMEARLTACYLHIGLDHLAYNAYLSDWPVLEATAKQMRRLTEEA
jgi:hygromycin-B 4-O-kinase